MERENTAWIPTLKLEKLLLPINFAAFYYQSANPAIDVELEIRLRLHLDEEKRYFTYRYFSRVSDTQEHSALGKFYGRKLYQLLINVATGNLSREFYGLVKHQFLTFESDLQYLFNIDIDFSKHLASNVDEWIVNAENTLPAIKADSLSPRTPSYSETVREVVMRYLAFLNPLNNSKMTQDDFDFLISFVVEALELPDLPKIPRVLDHVIVGKIPRDKVTASFCKIQRHYSKKRLPKLQDAMRAIFNYSEFETEETTTKNWTSGLKKYFPEENENNDN